MLPQPHDADGMTLMVYLVVGVKLTGGFTNSCASFEIHDVTKFAALNY